MTSPFGLLGGVAGGAQGLETLLARRLLQQKADEEARQNASENAYKQQVLAQNERRFQMEYGPKPQEIKAPAPVNWVNITDPATGVPKQVNPQTGEVRELKGFGPKPIETKPDPFDLFKREQDYRNATRPPTQNSEPLVPVQDANGVVIYTPRSQAVGKQKPVASAERAQGISADRTGDYLTQIATKFNADFVGPGSSRYLDLKQAIPGVGGNAAYGDFKSSVAALRNEMTRLLFSSRASDQDINRVQEQIPNMYDKPEVFLQKLRQTKANADALRKQLSTMGVP